jgi:hypothetical protein
MFTIDSTVCDLCSTDIEQGTTDTAGGVHKATACCLRSEPDQFLITAIRLFMIAFTSLMRAFLCQRRVVLWLL